MKPGFKPVILTLITVILVIFMNSALYARIYATFSGGTYFAGDAGALLGGELGAAYDLLPCLSVYLSPGYYSDTDNKDEPTEKVNSLVNLQAGLQYRHQITTAPFFLRGSAAFGGSYYYEEGPEKTGPFIDPSKTEKVTDYGPSFYVRAGVLYIVTQSLGVFCELGYGKSFLLDDFKDSSIGGFQILAGVQIPIGGLNRPVEEY